MTRDEAEKLVGTLIGLAQAVANAQDWPGAEKDPGYRQAVKEMDDARKAVVDALVTP